jgi:hypothetical protein
MKRIEVRKGVALSVKSRAQRFAIQMHLRYRLIGESKWRNGTTENVSRSGVLFWGEELAEPNTILDMRLLLPDEIPGVQSAEILCRGVVVRSERPKGVDAFPALASTIAQYRFIRP